MRERGDTCGDRVRVVRNGVAPPLKDEPAKQEGRRLVGLPEDGVVILCPARLEPEKGHDILLRALKVLRLRDVRFEAVLMGGGSLEGVLKQRVRDLNLRDCVRFVGHQSRSDVWMRASDIVVLPSPAEPFGLVLAEAMSRGIPVVAAAAGGPLEIVDSGSGRLFVPGNADDLAGHLRELVAEPLSRARLGAGGASRWSQHFSLQRMAREVSAVYAELSRDG
jgi:glycosyltransferase involved in cell wall biosynthesis